MKMPVECDLSPVGRDFQSVIASTAKNSLNGKRDAKKSKYKESGNICLHALTLTRVGFGC